MAPVEDDVLRAGLAVHGAPAGVGAADLLQRAVAGDVHDHERGVGHLGEPDRAAGRLRLARLRAGEAVPLRARVAAGERLLLQLGDDVAVLRVHHHQQAGVAGDLHRLEQVLVGRVERRALVGHEDLDRGDAELGEVRELLLDVLRHVGDGDVQPVVDVGLAAGLAVPGLDRLGERAVDVLEREVHVHRRAAGEQRRRARVPVVGGDRAAEGHVHVRVAVDEARHHARAGHVDHLRPVAREVDADGFDLVAGDRHVGAEGRLGGHHGATGEHEVAHVVPPSLREGPAWPGTYPSRGRDGAPLRSDVQHALPDAGRRADSYPRGRGQAPSRMARIGLVLPGGGARGAYEAGALSVLLPAARGEGTLLCGTSVGAINAACAASARRSRSRASGRARAPAA